MVIQNEIGKLIELYPVISELHPRLQRDLLDSSYRVQADRGQILFDFDDVIQSFILLTQGSIRVVWPGHERELLLYRVEPGGGCAISICHLLGATDYHARAEVESPIQGIALPQTLFRELLEQSPSFNYFILHTFSDRFAQLLSLVGRVSTMRLDERLARLLVSRGTPVYITHSQLADELGTVREVISRILKDFEAQGLIRLERGQIHILETENLRKISS